MIGYMRRILLESFGDMFWKDVVKEVIGCLTFGLGNEQTLSNCNILKEANEELCSIAGVNFG
jgi:hypothetical protein